MLSSPNSDIRRNILLTKYVLLCAGSLVVAMNAAHSQSTSTPASPALPQVNSNTTDIKTQNREKQEYLRQLKNSQSTLNNSLHITVVRVNGYKDGAAKMDPIEEIRAADQSGELHLKFGESFRLQITNNSAKSPLFLYLFMLGSSGSVQAIPIKSTDSLKPGESMKTIVMRASPPFGPETIKVLATTQPTDFSNVTTGRAIATIIKNPSEKHQNGVAAIGNKVELFDPKSTDWTTEKIDYVIEAPPNSGRDPSRPTISDAELKFMEGATEVELLSLNVDANYKGKAEEIEGFPIKSKTVITAREDRQDLINALQAGILEATSPARCFNPRHALRFKGANEIHDFVICFECWQVREFIRSTEDPKHFSKQVDYITSDRYQPEFDKLIKVRGK